MIQINCTNCKALLQIDDAFAGGVCRCRYCGTIQTVPKRLKSAGGGGNGDGGAMAQAEGAGAGSKTLWQKKGGAIDVGSGTGLDDLASIVASSGLSSSRLKKKPESTVPAARASTGAPAKQNNTVMLLAIAGCVIALLLGVIILMAIQNRPGGTDTSVAGGNGGAGGGPAATPGGNTTPAANVTPSTPTTPTTPGIAKAIGPSFLGQSIFEESVVFILDRGSASQGERLEGMKQALLASIKSLGPQRTFMVVFWAPEGGHTYTWPKDGQTLHHAHAKNIAEVRAALDEVNAFGQTNPKSAIERALKVKPAAVVFVPVKTFLPDDFQASVMKARAAAKSNAKFYCFSLYQPELAPYLRPLAQETGGAYKDVSLPELRNAGNE